MLYMAVQREGKNGLLIVELGLRLRIRLHAPPSPALNATDVEHDAFGRSVAGSRLDNVRSTCASAGAAPISYSFETAAPSRATASKNFMLRLVSPRRLCVGGGLLAV